MPINDAYDPIDLCACYEPMEAPPQDLVDAWKKYWNDHWRAVEAAKGAVPTFYVIDEKGVLYFYRGNTRIRVLEHFAENGKPIGSLIEDVICYAARQKICPPC